MRKDSASRPTILVVDENDGVLERVRALLEAAGYRVLTRSHVTGTIAAILQERPKLVLLGANLRHAAGDTVATILRRADPSLRTTILLHSALPPDVLRTRAAQAGVHGYIQKTSNRQHFVNQIRDWLKSGSSSSGNTRAVPPPEQNPSAGFPESATYRIAAGMQSVRIPAVLFVDDDPAALASYRRIMPGDEMLHGFSHTAADARQRIFGKCPPDVVVCDILIPGMTGADLYHAAVKLDPSWRRRFVFVTGAASISFVAEFLDSIEARVLHKPVDPKSLCQAIHSAAVASLPQHGQYEKAR